MDTIRLVHTDTLSCEAILRRTPKGSLIIVSQCGGTKEPDPGNRVYLFRSEDEGQTWSKPIPVVPENGKAQYQTEVSVIGDSIYIFMTEHDGNFTGFHSYIVRSTDDGNTFRFFCDVPVKKGFCFVRGMLEYGGKYLFPYQNYPVTARQDAQLQRQGRRIWDSGADFVEMGVLSTSDMRTFEASAREVRLPLRMQDGTPRWVWSEPTLAPLSDGSLAMLLRFDGRGRLYRSLSRDGGQSWEEAEPTEIPNPANKPKLLPLRDGRIALLNTPDARTGYAYRCPLALWVSDDDMRTWKYRRDLVTFPGWLSYPDGICSADGKQILFAFEFNRHDIYFMRADIPSAQ